MDTSSKNYTSLNVWASRQEDQGVWAFGVTMDGADVVLIAKKLGGVDSDLESARLAQQQQQTQTPPPQTASPTTQ